MTQYSLSLKNTEGWANKFQVWNLSSEFLEILNFGQIVYYLLGKSNGLCCIASFTSFLCPGTNSLKSCWLIRLKSYVPYLMCSWNLESLQQNWTSYTINTKCTSLCFVWSCFKPFIMTPIEDERYAKLFLNVYLYSFILVVFILTPI